MELLPGRDTVTTSTEIPQNIQALEIANRIRLARAQVKRDLRSGKTSLAKVLAETPDCILSAEVSEIVGAVNRWGRVRTTKLLQQSLIPPSRTVAALTDRQKQILGEAVV